MVSDAIPNAPIPIASSNPKDFSKKKRANRSAKLKQCKLDARREQWLSQVRNKGLKEDMSVGVGKRSLGVNVSNEMGRTIEKLEIKPREEEDNEVHDGSIYHYSDSESTSNSPTSHTTSTSSTEANDSGANFAGSSSCSISSCSGSGGCCSGNVSEADDDDCVDDWEAVADALAATDQKLEQHEDTPGERDETVQAEGSNSVTGIDTTKQKSEFRGFSSRPPISCKAWRPDDAFRPQILPNLSKQYSFPMNSERNCRGVAIWGCKRLSLPTSCPICCEDLDFTDASFLPCSCGFMLCLFCHKRILEEDGRCPGCRKKYNHDPVEGKATVDGDCLKFRLARSCSLISRT